MQVQQQGIEVAGHNMANVNNPAYARQRVTIQTSPTIDSALGPQGTGAMTEGNVQIRNGLLDKQIVTETSVMGSLEAQQQAQTTADLEQLEALLFAAAVAIRVLGRAGLEPSLLQQIADGATAAARSNFKTRKRVATHTQARKRK